MNIHLLTVREILPADVAHLVNYWQQADEAYLLSMGADIHKIPPRSEMTAMLLDQIEKPYDQKQSYCIIWQYNGEAIGHSNTNQIQYGEEANMHLHIWKKDVRMKGLGSAFLKMTLPWFFNKLQLQCLICEPYALNPSPNKTLRKTGFKFEKEYVTTPGYLNFEQPVNRWILTRDDFMSQYPTSENEHA